MHEQDPRVTSHSMIQNKVTFGWIENNKVVKIIHSGLLKKLTKRGNNVNDDWNGQDAQWRIFNPSLN